MLWVVPEDADDFSSQHADLTLRNDVVVTLTTYLGQSARTTVGNVRN